MIQFKSVAIDNETDEKLAVLRSGNNVEFCVEYQCEGYYVELNVEQVTKLRDALSVWLKGRSIASAKLYTGTKI